MNLLHQIRALIWSARSSPKPTRSSGHLQPGTWRDSLTERAGMGKRKGSRSKEVAEGPEENKKAERTKEQQPVPLPPGM